MQYTLNYDNIVLTVDTLGAEIVSLKHKGIEKLWQNVDAWNGHAPVLFPFCGNCQVWVEGKHYPMNRHGFARVSQFELASQKTNSLTFCLKANDQTQALYPFDFCLYVTYIVCGDSLQIDYTVQNLGKNLLHYACGGHESFVLPQPYGNYKLTFEKEEQFDTLLHNDDGQLTGERQNLGYGKILIIPTDGLQNRQTIILGNINSRKVDLIQLDGTPVCRLQFEGFAHLLLWSPDGDRTICIEPWVNLADSVDNATVEFGKKADIISLQPQEKRTLSRKITYLN